MGTGCQMYNATYMSERPNLQIWFYHISTGCPISFEIGIMRTSPFFSLGDHHVYHLCRSGSLQFPGQWRIFVSTFRKVWKLRRRYILRMVGKVRSNTSWCIKCIMYLFIYNNSVLFLCFCGLCTWCSLFKMITITFNHHSIMQYT